MTRHFSERVTVITGASSGIGAALARRLAAVPGAVLGLTGRDAGRLEATAATCRAAGATVETAIVDTRDRAGMAAWLAGFDARHPIHCVIANAGIAAGSLPEGPPERGEQIYTVFETNLGGTLNLVVPAIPLLQARGRGRIVLISSLSAFAPLPEAAAYSGSKAAAMTFGLALRQFLAPDGIRVNVVCPGFVTTPMAATFRGWRPLEMSADEAASRILAGMARDKGLIVFPWPLAAIARLTPFVPEPLLRKAMTLFRL